MLSERILQLCVCHLSPCDGSAQLPSSCTLTHINPLMETLLHEVWPEYPPASAVWKGVTMQCWTIYSVCLMNGKSLISTGVLEIDFKSISSTPAEIQGAIHLQARQQCSWHGVRYQRYSQSLLVQLNVWQPVITRCRAAGEAWNTYTSDYYPGTWA